MPSRGCHKRGCTRPKLDGYSTCQACLDWERAYAQIDRVKRQRRNAGLLRLYGIDVDEFERLLATQGGKCAICGSGPEPPYANLQVDHCHEGGGVRGLLCHKCNKAIGLLGDHSRSVRAAAEYLERAGT